MADALCLCGHITADRLGDHKGASRALKHTALAPEGVVCKERKLLSLY